MAVIVVEGCAAAGGGVVVLSVVLVAVPLAPPLNIEVRDTLAGLIAEIIFGTYFTIAAAMKKRISNIPTMTSMRTSRFGFFSIVIFVSLICFMPFRLCLSYITYRGIISPYYLNVKSMIDLIIFCRYNSVNMKQNNDFLKDEKTKFIALFASIFLGTFLILYFIGFVPDELSSDGESALNDLKLQTIESVSQPAPKLEEPKNVEVIGETPVYITAPKVGISVQVENPKSADNAVLNGYLAKGAVRYPGSADLGTGNTFIFGHSSNWAVVQNNAYKALNGIEKLVRGDEIYVDSDSHRFVYQVMRVYQSAADEAYVDLSSDKNMLTLSTCDIFGAKQSRFVVEAIFSKKISL